MIRKISILAALILLSAAAVGTAYVTPSAATNYIFTTPLFPATIRGEVMGDPPEYYDPRGEDVDWIFEAFEERIALMNGQMPSLSTYLEPSFGKWSLNNSNLFYRYSTAVDAAGATNIVVGYTLVTNATRFALGRQDVKTLYYSLPVSLTLRIGLGGDTGEVGYRSRYIDGDVPLSDGPRVAYDTGNAPLFTNATYTLSYTNAVVTNVTTISMPMTNGTTSVFTNMWIATMELQATNSVTNVVEACPLDYCHASDGPFPGFPNAPAFRAAILRPTRDGVTAQMYGALRAAVRLSDTVTPTNSEKCVSYYRHEYSDEDGSYVSTSVYTNSQATAEYSVSGTSEYTYEWNEDKQDYDLYYGCYVTGVKTFLYEAVAPTRFNSDLVTTGGADRVEIEAAYAVVEFSYEQGHREGDVPDDDFVTDVESNKVVVVPLEKKDFTLDTSHEKVLARIQMDAMSLCGVAAEAAEAPSPPEDAEVYEPPTDEYQKWSAKCSSVVLIYKIKPSSKFVDWEDPP